MIEQYYSIALNKILLLQETIERFYHNLCHSYVISKSILNWLNNRTETLKKTAMLILVEMSYVLCFSPRFY